MKVDFWIFLLCVCLLTGCGEAAGNAGQESSAAQTEQLTESVPNTVEPISTIETMELIESENPAEENLADRLQTTGKGMMVQIETGGLMGSGVLFDEQDGKLRIVSAAHIFEQTDNLVRIIYADGFESYSREFVLFTDEDIAVIYVEMNSIPAENRKAYRLANVDFESFDKLTKGDGCIAMGSKTGVAAEAYEGTILDTFILFEDYGHYLLWAKAEVKPGMSGGGLFDSRGHYIGILSGGNEKGELAVVPLSIIRSKLY